MDHHFPRYHVRPPSGYVNDPNGPVRLNDRWHLFFQYVSDTVRHGAVVWGHATSDDLATWRLHRPALSPDPEGIDRDGCWSGNVVAHDGDLIAFYSGFRREHPYQSVLAARSTDGGQSFGPAWEAVPDPDPAEGVVTLRDPFVWQDGDIWLMVVGAGDSSGLASTRLYTSPDLETWTYRGHYASMARAESPQFAIGEMWECPQVMSFGDRDALLVGTWGPGSNSEVLALTGVRADLALQTPHISRVDFGPNFYAASAMRGDPPIVWGWVTEGRSGDWTVEADWSGMLSLPRTMSLTADGRLASTPHPALDSLRKHTLDGDFGAQFEVEMSLHDHGAPTVLSLRCGAEEHLDITVDWAAGRVSIDRDHASSDLRAHGGVHSFEDPEIQSGTLGMRWFVDGSVSELFTRSGYSSTLRFYATEAPPWTLTTSGLAADDAITTWALT